MCHEPGRRDSCASNQSGGQNRKKIQQLLQKTGEVALDRKNVKTPADVRSVYPYTPTPVKNDKYPFYVKQKTRNPKP